jgi:hypothetical protein
VTLGLGVGTTLAVGTASAGAVMTRGTDASWTRGVCSAVTGWLGTVAKASGAAKSTSGDPRATQKALDGMLRSAGTATAKLVKQLKAAGTPATGGGSQLVPVAKEQFTRVRQVIESTRTAIAAAPTSDATAFSQKILGAQGSLESALEAVQAAFGAATFGDVAPLVGVFTASDRCRGALVVSGSGITVTPSVVAPGRDVVVAPAGVTAAASTVCSQTSAFKTELLDANGTRVAIGARTLSVPADAKPGVGTVRLVCYLPDAAGRRVIRGMCGAVTIGTGSTPSTAPTAVCPATPRLVLSQGVIVAESTLSEGFNRLL